MLPSRIGRLERRRGPLVERIGRLHVVVAVDQRDRLAGHRRRLGKDDRMAGGFDRARSSRPSCLNRVDHPVGGFAHVGSVARVGADARDAQQIGEVVDERLAVGLDICRRLLSWLAWLAVGRPI